MMKRRQTSALTLLLLAAACAIACGGGGKQSAAQDERPPLNLEIIRRDINGRWVETPSADGQSKPVGWVFDRREPKEIEIVDQKIEGDRATFLVNMKTHTVPHARNPRSLSGQLRLHYELQSGFVLREWEIVEVENVSFTYVNEPPEPSAEKKRDEGDEDEDDSRGGDAKPATNANAANSNAKPATNANAKPATNANTKPNAKPAANRNSTAHP